MVVAVAVVTVDDEGVSARGGISAEEHGAVSLHLRVDELVPLVGSIATTAYIPHSRIIVKISDECALQDLWIGRSAAHLIDAELSLGRCGASLQQRGHGLLLRVGSTVVVGIEHVVPVEGGDSHFGNIDTHRRAAADVAAPVCCAWVVGYVLQGSLRVVPEFHNLCHRQCYASRHATPVLALIEEHRALIVVRCILIPLRSQQRGNSRVGGNPCMATRCCTQRICSA